MEQNWRQGCNGRGEEACSDGCVRGLTLMISQYLCQRGLSQQVEGNMSASEAAIREYPAATHSAVSPCLIHRHT